MGNGKKLKSKHPFKRNEDGSYSVIGEFRIPKITGTYLGGAVGHSPWATPFSTACSLLGLYGEDLSDLPAIKTGIALEPVILDFVKDYGVIPAEELYADRRGPHNGWKQDFEDEIFGGHVDGVTEDGKVVEVKTTSDARSWLNGPPEHYWLQASLYAHFLGSDEIMFVVGVVDAETYNNPYEWKPEGNVSVKFVPLHPKLDEYLDEARKFHSEYIVNGRTPVPDPNSQLDMMIAGFLDAQLMQDEDAYELVTKYESILDQLAEVKVLEDKAEEIKSQLLVYMESKNIDFVYGHKNAFKRLVTVQHRVDSDALKRDGIFDKYSKTTTVTSFRKTKM